MKRLLQSAIIITLQENSSDQYKKFVYNMMSNLERYASRIKPSFKSGLDICNQFYLSFCLDLLC